MTDPSVREWRRVMAAAHGQDWPVAGWNHLHADGQRWTHPAGVGCDESAPGDGAIASKVPSVDEVVAANTVAKNRHEDVVNTPSHYTHLPVECIDVAEHFGYRLGNVIKYVWRADYKGKPLEDLRKARYYLEREIQKREQDDR